MNYFLHINLSFEFITPQIEVYKLLQNQFNYILKATNVDYQHFPLPNYHFGFCQRIL